MQNQDETVTRRDTMEAIARTLFQNYESIYDIDIETGKYFCYHQSESYREFGLAESGDDFFADLKMNVLKVIYQEDREYVADMMSKAALLEGVDNDMYYSFIYRMIVNGKPLYVQARAKSSSLEGKTHVFIGVRDIDYVIKQERHHSEELESMLQKEKNHTEAVLASSAGYLEVNLTKDIVTEVSKFNYDNGNSMPKMPYFGNTPRYSDIRDWIVNQLIASNNEKYNAVSHRENLIECFERGEARASCSFSLKTANGTRPCREIFFLYRDNASQDIMSFCVIYDLTDTQRREKEMKELEYKLQMSRIRNFTGQMQPHFLYNALGSIQEIILEDPEYASQLLGDFTKHLRYCIRSMTTDEPIPFSQELENIEAYVNIERMRFGDKLNVTYDIGTEDFDIIPLSIQPIVENAIRHGIYELDRRSGRVTLRTREDDDNIYITVQDDGVGFDVEKWRRGLDVNKDAAGLKNLIFRLDKMMNAEVDITSTVGKGTTVVCRIPKEADK